MNINGITQSLAPHTGPHRSRAVLRSGAGVAAFCLGALFATHSVSAVTFERVQPKAPGDTGITDPNRIDGSISGESDLSATETAEEARLDTVLLDELKGIVFVDAPASIQQAGRRDVEGVTADASLPMLSDEAFTASVADKYLGEALTLRKLNALNRDTVAYLRGAGYPVVDVIVPQQDITDGSVQFIVLTGRVGEVRFQGNEYFSSELLASQIRTAGGGVVRAGTVRDDLNWMNRNPFRQVNLMYSRGDEVGETDLTFQVTDRRPLRAYAGYENSGTKSTDRDRYLLGFNWGNAFGLDHQLNYQFTFTGDLDDFYAHSGSYLMPLPWRHVLSFYGAYSNSSAEVAAGLLDAEGESYTLGLRYTVPLRSSDRFTHEVYAGYEYKYSENELFFFGSALPKTQTEVSQFNIGYSAGLRDRWGSTSLNATFFYSPGDMLSHDSDEDYEVLYNGDSEYAYGLLSLERTVRLPRDFSLLASVTGQLANENLLISEQLGAGGYATVRGYEERAVNAEEGVLTSLELRSPSFAPLSALDVYEGRLPKDQMQLLAFWDYAHLERHDPDPDSPIPDADSLSSAGVGLRYSVSDNLSLRFDYGWQLKDSSVGEKGDSRGHVGVVLSY